MATIERGRDQDEVVGAHRYFLGELSYSVKLHIRWLTMHWDQLTEQTKAIILEDTFYQLKLDLPRNRPLKPAAWPEYAVEWAGFFKWGWPRTGEAGRRAVANQATGHVSRQILEGYVGPLPQAISDVQ